MQTKDFKTNSSLKIKVVIGSEFVGFDSGWPTRYIGLIKELYKYHSLSIFAPGNTSLLSKMFQDAFVCKSTTLPLKGEGTKIGLSQYLKELVKPSRYTLVNFDPPYSKELNRLISKDMRRYDVSIYFGMLAFVFYGEGDNSSRILCDFCDSYLRHKYNDLRTKQISGIKNYLSTYFDICYIKRVKKKWFSPDITILAITDEDGKYISGVLKRNKVLTVPNGVNLPKIVVDNSFIRKKYKSRYLVFIGSLDYKPNIESILFTLRHIWPYIHERFPHLVFRIVGRSPGSELIKLAGSVRGVELVGPVDSVMEYYIDSKCFLGPIFSGGGMKNKFLESLSSGTPVITTPEGAIGINIVSGIHGKIGSTKSQLLQGTFDLLSCSESQYSDYVKSSICLAKEYSWEKVGVLLNNIIQGV